MKFLDNEKRALFCVIINMPRKGKEEKAMLLKRDNVISDNTAWFYPLNNHKTVCFEIERDRSIERIGLINCKENKGQWHDIKTLCYMENITMDDGELLNVDALLALAKREDEA